MREILHRDEYLTITLVIDEEADLVRLELASEVDGPDLSVVDEVVVVVDGEGRPLDVESARRAQAVLGPASGQEKLTMTLMVRVHEFFDGWEFG